MDIAQKSSKQHYQTYSTMQPQGGIYMYAYQIRSSVDYFDLSVQGALEILVHCCRYYSLVQSETEDRFSIVEDPVPVQFHVCVYRLIT